ncbi:MAG: hypothetical protein WCY00_00300 [Candidatus Dojkabacteria bacterium]|jgi:hypothetical protein
MSMKERIVPTIAIASIFVYYLFSLITQGLNYLHNDLIFALISALSLLTLPALISKVILKKNYFGVGYILSTLIYPTLYIFFLLLNKIFGADMVILYSITTTLIIATSLFLLSLITITESKYHTKKVSLAIVGIITVILLIIGSRKLLGLEKDSLLSLDFLQHNVVSTQMTDGNLCITPNQCSSLFKKLGYTTYYHTIQTVHTVGSNLNIGIAEVSLNIAFIAVSSLLISLFLNRHIKDKTISFLASLSAIFVFEIGAHSFNFILPQTLTFFLFLNILLEKNLNWKKVLLVTPILISTHFIFGPLFTALSIISITVFNPHSKPKNFGLAKTFTLLSFLSVIITFFANLRGFSIEKLLQIQDIEQIGYLSNYYFPDNLKFLATQYGPLLIPLIIAAVYFIFKKKDKGNISLFAIFYISVSLSLFFLGPTYANKFLLGSTVFMILLICLLLLDLRTNKILAITILSILFTSSLPFYLLNSQKYNLFYTQNTGKISAISNDDNGIVMHLKNNKYDCQIVSDPYTQLIVASYTDYQTAGGHYQELKTREALVEFVNSPKERTYEELLIAGDIKRNNLCILLSSRIYSKKRYVNQDNIPWLNSMYEYEINNNYGIPDIEELGLFLLSKGYEIVYLDSNFRLLVVPN